MIFVTVGSQMPFRRLIQAMDHWAQDNPSVEIQAQMGNDESFRPVALKAFASVPPAKYTEIIEACELVVAHAGMGTVMTALKHGKPMLLMPRRGAWHETRNDHQIATLRWLRDKPGIYPAEDAVELKAALDLWRSQGLAAPPQGSANPESLNALVMTMRTFIG